MRQVLVSSTARKRLDELVAKERPRLVRSIGELGEGPFRRRPGANIKKLEGTNRPKYRLRVVDWRIVYLVDDREVRVIEILARGRGYRLE